LKARLIATLILVLVVVMFLIQNAAVVEIRMLFWQIAMPRSLLIFIMLVIGIVIGWFARAMYKITRTKSD
jgi:uncharacterized integral membrane protein